MKKGISFALALALAPDLTACSAGGDDTRSTGNPSPAVGSPAAGAETPSTPETVIITSLNVDKGVVGLEVLYDPQCIAILDIASLGILDTLGVAGGRVVGSVDTSLDYLQSYATDESVANLGIIKTADPEAVMVAQPDVIPIGGRLAKSCNALSEIAPVVYLVTDSELSVAESVRQNVATIASMFGLKDRMDKLMTGFDARVQTLTDFVADKTAVVGMCISGGFNVLGNNGRCSIIDWEIGFENIDVDADIDTSTHGNEASFEFVVEENPDHIFTMGRDAAIQTDGIQLVQEIIESEPVMGTDVYKNSNIVYLAHPAVWYTAEGGITALDIMLQDLESELPG